MAVEGIGRGKIIPIELLRRRAAGSPMDAGDRKNAGVKGDRTPPPASSEPPERSSSTPPTRDRVPKVGERERLLESLRELLKDLPETRRDKVIEAKLRMSKGYYDRDEIRREVLRSVLQSLLPPRSSDPDAGGPGTPEAPATEGTVADPEGGR